LTYLIGILLVLALLWLLQPQRERIRSRLKEQAGGLASKVRGGLAEAWRRLDQPAGSASGPSVDSPASAQAGEAAGGESLSARLQGLESVFGSTAHSAAHPRELAAS